MRIEARQLTVVVAVLLALQLSSSAGAAGLDRTLNIQGAVYTSAGMPANGTFPMTFRFYDAISGGTKVWEQPASSVAVASGVFDVELGPVPAGVLEDHDKLWLETDVDGVKLPREPLRSAPYAIVSQVARVAQDLQCSGCVEDTDIKDGAVTPSKVGSGTYGINISGNATTATTATNAASAAVFSGSLGGDVTGGQTATMVVKIRGIDVAAVAPNNGQVLKYDATQLRWEPANDDNAGGTVKSVATGQGLSGGPITSTGTIQLRMNANGGLSKTLGTSSNELGIAAGGVQPGMVASGQYGISISGNAATATTATDFSGSLNGDIGGTQGATLIQKLRGVTVSGAAPGANQVLKYNATSKQWEPSSDSTGTGTVTQVGTGAGLQGGPITTNGTVSLRLSSGGGLTSGLGASTNELGIAGNGVVPGMVKSGTYSIDISGNAATATIAATADSLGGSLAGDVTGGQTTTKVTKIQGFDVATTAPTGGKVLKFNATSGKWEPGTDNNGQGGTVSSVSTGSGLSGGPITSTGTINLALASSGGLTKAAGTGTELGIAANGVQPGMVSSGTYSINVSGNAATATSATSAGSATDFTGDLGGDVTGKQASTTVAKIRGVSVSTTAPANGQVLKYSTSTGMWAPGTDAKGPSGTVTTVNTGAGLQGGPISTTGTVDLRLSSSGGLSSGLGTGSNELGVAANGIVPGMVSSGLYGINISGNAATATSATSAGSATTAGSATSFTGALGGDVTGTQASTKVGKIQSVAVAATAPVNGQVLKFNGTAWTPATDTSNSGTVTSVGTGQGLSGGAITGAGTINLNLYSNGGLSKTLGTGSTQLGIKAGGIVPSMMSAGPYSFSITGNAATATSATSAGSATTAGSAGNFTNALGGDVTGNQTTTKVGKIQSVAVATTPPTSGQVLKFNGTAWAPAADSSNAGTVKSVGTGTGLTGGTITSTGTINLSLDTNGGLSSTQGTGSAQLGIKPGGIVPGMVSNTTYTMSITGNAATATTATSATTAGTATNFSGSLNGDVTGKQTTAKVVKIQGVGVATTAPTSGQVMKFNGTAWAPSTDASNAGTVTSVGTGQGLTGGTITGAGTINLNVYTNGGLSKTLGTGSAQLGVKPGGIVPSMMAAGPFSFSITGNAATATSATTAGSAGNFTNALSGDVTGNQTTTKVTKIQGFGVATTTPGNNQILKYSTSTGLWTPSADATGGSVSSVATGNGLMGGTITTTGKIDLRIGANGGLSSTLGTGANELGIKPSGIVPSMVSGGSGSYGINITGSAGSATTANSATTATNFSAALNGDITGNQTTTKVSKIQGKAVSTTAPSSGQVLKFNGTQWAPAADSTGSGVTSVTASAPLSATGTTAVTITLNGTVATNRGGTGMTTAPSAAGQFMRSTGSGAWGVATIAAGDIPAGSNNYIKNGTGAQTASFNATGTGTIGTLSVTGNGTVGGTLSVTGASTMNGLLTAKGGVTNNGGTLALSSSTDIVSVEKYLYMNGKNALRATDSWLRLNQDAGFANGTYTPGFLRADGGFASGNVSGLGNGTIIASSLIKPGNSTATCNPTIGGALRWTGTQLDMCNGTAWVKLAGATPACSCPSGFTTSGSNCLRTYDIDTANLYGMSDFCGTGEYYNCSGSIGFNWTDLGSSVGAVTAVSISVSSGIVCSNGISAPMTLNGTSFGSYAPPTNNCMCTAIGTIMALGGIPVGSYKKGQSNSLGLPMLGGTCVGLHRNSAFNNKFARVTTTYACQ